MVAEGAFKSITLSGEIDNLLQQVSAPGKTSKDIITLLSQIVARFPTKISRTLITANDTSSNAIVESKESKPRPIEVLYMERLNSMGNPVDMIIK